MSHLECGSVVWVKLGQAWWPGTVTTMAKCPPEFVQGLRKMPLSIVKFFHENEFQDVHKAEHIYPYDCERKEEFIKKGQYINKNQSHGDVDLLAKFEADVVTAEKLTGGDMNILQTIGEVAGKRRIDYSDLGFGPPKPKKKKEDLAKRGSDIGQAVVYKKVGIRSAGNKFQRVVIEHKVRILEQPRKENMAQDMREASNWYKCYCCGYTCSRLNVIIWHNKAHINKVCNYDTGIKVPGRRKRKQGTPRANKEMRKKAKDSKGKENLAHAHTNGEVSSPKKDSQDTQQLLMDWDDEDDDGGEGERSKTLSGGLDKRRNESDDGYSDNDDYPPPQPKYERRPMPKAADINSAFDALLATTPVTPSTNQMTNYVNNDSDSDYSDWEKYYARDSGSESEEEEVAQESDIKSLCEEKESITSENTDGITRGENNDEIDSKCDDIEASSNLNKPNATSTGRDEEEENLYHESRQVDQSPKQEEADYVEEREAGPEKLDEEMERSTSPVQYTENQSVTESKLGQGTSEPELTEPNTSINNQTEFSNGSLHESIEPEDSVEEPEMNAQEPHEVQGDESESVNEGALPDCEEALEVDIPSKTPDQQTVCMKASQKTESETVQNNDIEKEREMSDVEDNETHMNHPPNRIESVSENIAEPMRASDVATSSGSGTTYMLVAVDAHGNTVPTVPTPALSEGSSNLVAVEATMEDGTTRTLYIDPSQLGPNVDLNNLMLHIDTSGQEHVIIPSSSSSDSETPSLEQSMSEGQDRNFSDSQSENQTEPLNMMTSDLEQSHLPHHEKEKFRAAEVKQSCPNTACMQVEMSGKLVATSGSRNPPCVTNEDFSSRHETFLPGIGDQVGRSHYNDAQQIIRLYTNNKTNALDSKMIIVNKEEPQVVSECGDIGFSIDVSESDIYHTIPTSCNREIPATSDQTCDNKVCEAFNVVTVGSGCHETLMHSKEQECPHYKNNANANNQEISPKTTDKVNAIIDLKVKDKMFESYIYVDEAENVNLKITSEFNRGNLNEKVQIISKKEMNLDEAHQRHKPSNMGGEREGQCNKDEIMTERNICGNDFCQLTENTNTLVSSMQNLEEVNTKIERIESKYPTVVENEEPSVEIADSSCGQDLLTRSREVSFFKESEMDKCVIDQNKFDEIYKSKMRRRSKRIQHTTREEKYLEKSENSSKLKTKNRKRRNDDTFEMKYEDFNDNVMRTEDDDDFPDLTTCSLRKEIWKPELAVNNIVWTLHRGKWWPSYVKCVYSRCKKVSVNFIGCEQSVGIKVNWKKIRAYQQGHIPLFVDQSPQGLLEAVELCNSFINICKYREDFLPCQFFSLPAEERDALMKPKKSSDVQLNVSSVSKKRRSVREETPSSNKKFLKEKEKMDEMCSMSARDKKKLEIAIQARRKENEKLLKYIRSEDCISHLWQIFRGEKMSKRHEMYQEQYSRKMLMWSGVGPFHLDEEDEQILEVIDFLHLELSSKEQDFVQAHDYAILVWMPEAIKEALRVVKKVPENELENALDTGYRETRTEKKARRLDFTFL